MESLLFLIGLVVLAVPVTLIYLLVAVARLKGELRDLKALLRQGGPDPVARPGAIVPKGPDTMPKGPETVQQTPKPAAAAESIVPKPPETVQDLTTGPAARGSDVPDVPETVQQTPRAPWGEAARVAPAAPAGPNLFARVLDWMRENWFYAVSALSLALAGVFLVQYGIETGLLTPTMRVLAALGLGAALIGAGETIRRRFGDGADSSTAYLPSVLSGAGLVSLFGGVLAARLLYDLAGPGAAFAGLVAITGLGLVLGWLTGPLLAAVALLGGFAAPFLVGGDTDSLEWLMGYFTLLAALGLGIDTLRRWAWVSVLSLALGFGAGWLLWAGAPGDSLAAAHVAMALALVVLACLIPARGLWPDHAGEMLTGYVLARVKNHTPDTTPPIFPVMLAAGALLAACAVLLAMGGQSATLFWIATAGATALAALFILWSGRATALSDLAALPALALLALIALPELSQPVQSAMAARAAALAEQTETRMPLEITALFGMGLLLTLIAAWRSLRRAPHPVLWAGFATLIAPAAGLVLELNWQPAQSIGTWAWALHALTLAALLTLLAERYGRRDGAERLRPALAGIAALASLAFACTVLLTSAALTLALATTVLAAAALDRRFQLPPMEYYILAGVVALGYRLGFDPGLDWATRAPVFEMLTAYGGSTALLVLALVALPERPRARVMVETAAWAAGGMTLNLGLYHLFAAFTEAARESHWSVGLYGTIWAVLALVQLERLRLGGSLRWLRKGLAGIFGLTAGGFLMLGIGPANPLIMREVILGPPVVNSLMAAYLLPALVLGLGAWRMVWLPVALRGFGAIAGLGLGVLWAGLAIRHLWRGSDGMLLSAGVTQPELYSYTVALLLVGAVLFYQALARRSDMLRRVGTGVIALAVAKVFLIDASGLNGLARVLAFLLLGLSLAGLAWLNRWAGQKARDP